MALITRAGAAAMLVCLLAAVGAQARGILAGRRALLTSTSDSHDHTLMLGKPLSGEGLSLLNISGVWYGLGDAYDNATWSAYFMEGKLPDCAPAKDTVYTWKHWSEPEPEILVFEAGGSGIVGHHEYTLLLKDVEYDGTYLKAVWAEGGDKSCYHVSPYVDAASGHLHVRLATRTQWKLKDKKIEWTDASCTLTAADVAAPSCTKIDDHTVHSVSITTHRCKAGNCLNYSPSFLERKDKE